MNVSASTDTDRGSIIITGMAGSAASLPTTAQNPLELSDSSLPNPRNCINGLTNLQLAHEIVLTKIAMLIPDWREQFLSEFDWRVEIVLEGSFKIGNFVGSKKSFNPSNDLPVVDVDISLRLPKFLNPSDPEVIAAVEKVTGAKLFQSFNWDYWGVIIPASVLFKTVDVPAFQELVGTTQMELELIVRCKGDGVAFSDYWERIFTPTEIRRQIEEKNQAADLGVNEYKRVKAQHDIDARWRIIAGWHMGVLDNVPKKFISVLSEWYKWTQKGTEGNWDGVSENIIPREPDSESHRWVQIAWFSAQRALMN